MAPPTGLRALHKADRSRRLLDTATRLFRDHGYDAVRIEDIAAEAQLSPGTVYNYFSTKGEILLAIVTLEVEEVLAQGAAVLAAPGPGFQEAMGALIGGYYDHSLHYLSKAMWRTAMAQTIATPDSAFSQHYLSLDRRLTDQRQALDQHVLMQAIDVLYELVWAKGEGVTDPAAVARALEAAGLPGAAMVAEASTPAAKERVRTHTEDALARGVFGVPTFEVVRTGEIFWGQDSIPHVERHLAGEDPVTPAWLEPWKTLPKAAVRPGSR